MKLGIILGIGLMVVANNAIAQVDTSLIAIQDFELSPATPTWTYTGTPNGFLEGNSSPSAAPPNSPFGLMGSRAWHTVQVSGGNPVVFDSQIIPAGFDRVIARFSLAAMNTNGDTGGPDDLDYVLVEYTLDNGVSYTARVRARGAVANNSFWPYSASGGVSVAHLPATEVLVQPTSSGLQDAEAVASIEIVFPGSVPSVGLRITPRSSSSTDSWLIDEVSLIGETDTPVELLHFQVD